MNRYDEIHEDDRESMQHTKQWAKSKPLPDNIGDMWMKFFNAKKENDNESKS